MQWNTKRPSQTTWNFLEFVHIIIIRKIDQKFGQFNFIWPANKAQFGVILMVQIYTISWLKIISPSIKEMASFYWTKWIKYWP